MEKKTKETQQDNMTKTEPTYKLTVQIGKKPVKGKVYRFKTKDPVESLLTINIPKMMEEVIFTLEKGDKKAVRSMTAFRARRVLNSKLNAFYLIKNMHFILK